MRPDYYAELGVSRDATEEEITQAFRRLAAQYHPDRNPGHEDRFKRISEAYAVLKDPKSRETYDRGEDTGFEGFDTVEDVFQHFADFFAPYEAEITVPYHEAASGTRRSVRVGRRVMEVTIPPGTTDGTVLQLGPMLIHVRVEPPYRTTVEIDLPTAVLGGEVEVPVPAGIRRMKVPPGTQPGQVFRLAGQGYRGGDAYATVSVRIPKRLSDEQRQAIERLRRSPW